MWAGFFGFLAGIIVATIVTWSLVARRARRPLEAKLEAAHEALENATELYKSEKRRADEYFSAIEGACNERTGWAQKYQQMAAEAGNAQDLMLSVVEGLCRQLEALGKKAEVPKIIRQLRAEFCGRHVTPKKESVEKPAVGT